MMEWLAIFMAFVPIFTSIFLLLVSIKTTCIFLQMVYITSGENIRNGEKRWQKKAQAF